MMKVLVIEDEQPWQSALISAVNAAGFEPIPSPEATNAALILEHVLDIRLVILDWNLIAPGDLPSATGEGLAAIAQKKGIPVIVVSGALHDPDFLKRNQIEDPMDESHRLRSKYGVCEWLPKKRLEAELELSPPLPMLIKLIRNIRPVSTEKSLLEPQDCPSPQTRPTPITQPLIPPPYLISIKGERRSIYVTITTQSKSNTLGVSKTLNDNYALLMEELCSAAENGDSVVSYKSICELIPSLDSAVSSPKKMKEDVEKFLESFRQWLLRNVTGEGRQGRDLIKQHLFNKTGDGIRLGHSAKYKIQESSRAIEP
jgi:hypothetical protein